MSSLLVHTHTPKDSPCPSFEGRYSTNLCVLCLKLLRNILVFFFYNKQYTYLAYLEFEYIYYIVYLSYLCAVLRKYPISHMFHFTYNLNFIRVINSIDMQDTNGITYTIWNSAVTAIYTKTTNNIFIPPDTFSSLVYHASFMAFFRPWILTQDTFLMLVDVTCIMYTLIVIPMFPTDE